MNRDRQARPAQARPGIPGVAGGAPPPMGPRPIRPDFGARTAPTFPAPNPHAVGGRFTELGRMADSASLAYERAAQWLSDKGPEGLGAALSLDIAKANFGDGTQQLEAALKRAVMSNLTTLLTEAMAELMATAHKAREELREAFNADIEQGAAGSGSNGKATGPDTGTR